MRLPSFAGVTRPSCYAILAPVLLLAPHAAVALLLRTPGLPLLAGAGFSLLPLRQLTMSPDLPAGDAAIAFAVALIAAGALALLSFRRANWSGAGYALAAVVVVPAVQIAAAAMLALLPRFEQHDRSASAPALAPIAPT